MDVKQLIEEQTKAGKPIVRINRGMLAAMVESIPPKQRGNFWTIYTRTQPKLLKKHRIDKGACPHDVVVKIANVQLQIDVDYESCVNAQRAREGKAADFEVKPRQWGKNVGGSLIEHKGNFYLELPSRKCLLSYYEDGEGNPIEGEALEYLKGFLPTKSASRQGLENEIVWRTYKLESILALAANHVFWQIVD